jgi:hypothetical protein
MISSASQLLEAFISKAVDEVQAVNMPHMPTLGEAYEAITKKSIDQQFILPPGLDLKVVSGFIRIDDYFSGQVDCMLVSGDGEPYGMTDKHIYSIEQVLCVFEVKKTLNKSDLKDAVLHLAEIKRAFGSWLVRKLDAGWSPDVSGCSKIYSQITGLAGPQEYRDIFALPKENQIIFFSLAQEFLGPSFIIHGYGGFKTEAGLRGSFLDIFEQLHSSKSDAVSIPTFPSLITSNEFSLVKSNGIPFLMVKDNSWVVLGSCRYNPARMILEVIWSKLSVHFGRRMPFNDSLWAESVWPLMVARPTTMGSRVGWICDCQDYKEKHLKRTDDKEWEPSRLNPAEVSILNQLAFNGGEVELTDSLKRYIREKFGRSLESVIESLTLTRELMLDGNSLRLVGHFVAYLKVSETEAYLASDKRLFDMWCDKHGLAKHYVNIVLMN